MCGACAPTAIRISWSAWCATSSAYVLGQAVVDQKTNEITAVPALLAGRDLSGTVTTMDALLTQWTIARQILNQGGHYLMVVKKNQLNLYRALELLFQTPPVPAQPGELLVYTYHGRKEHGRLEQRTLESSIALNPYVDWPGVGQVLRRTCRRLIVSSGVLESETTYGLTSLPRALAGPKLVERFWRGHWTIENVLHYVRDETLGEDRCPVYTGTDAPSAGHAAQWHFELTSLSWLEQHRRSQPPVCRQPAKSAATTGWVHNMKSPWLGRTQGRHPHRHEITRSSTP